VLSIARTFRIMVDGLHLRTRFQWVDMRRDTTHYAVRFQYLDTSSDDRIRLLAKLAI
jgi:hypothetical protein